MSISRETAKALMAVVNACGADLARLLPALESELSQQEFRAITREIGRVISTMDDSISSKVAAEYPDLAPEALPIARKLK